MVGTAGSQRQRAIAIAWGYSALKVLAPAPWAVLMVLVRRVNNKRDDFEVWPDQTQIAEDAAMSLSSVKRHLKLLEDRGFFVRRARQAKGRGFTGLVYSLAVKAEFGMPGGSTVDERFDQRETAQIDPHRQVNADPHRQSTVDLCNTEPRNKEPIEVGTPPNPQGGEDLFGQPESTDLDEHDIAALYIERWNVIADQAPRLQRISSFAGKQRKDLIRRIDETVKSRAREPIAAMIDKLLAQVNGSAFLRGDSADWRTPAAWPVLPRNFEKIMGGFYVQDAAGDRAPTRNRDHARDRSFDSTGQEVCEFLDRLDRAAAESGRSYPFGYR